jgi:hypothetical protein
VVEPAPAPGGGFLQTGRDRQSPVRIKAFLANVRSAAARSATADMPDRQRWTIADFGPCTKGPVAVA